MKHTAQLCLRHCVPILFVILAHLAFHPVLPMAVQMAKLLGCAVDQARCF